MFAAFCTVVESLSVMAEKVALDCMAPVCDLGTAGTRYKIPLLEETNAMEMLRFHMQQNHVQCSHLVRFFRTLVRIRTFFNKLVRKWSGFALKSPDLTKNGRINAENWSFSP